MAISPIAEAYLVAASSAAPLLAEPAVAARWAEPSALARFTVGGLAGHLAGQVLFVGRTLDAPPPGGEPVPLLGHYDRVILSLGSIMNLGSFSTACRGPHFMITVEGVPCC